MSICSSGSGQSQCDSFITAEQARRSKCDRLVWLEIFLIQNAILDATDDCDTCVTVSNKTPITSFSTVDEITVLNGGQDYFPVVASANIIHPNGFGEEIEVIVSSTGIITSFLINDGGEDYEPVVATANATAVGGGDAEFNVVVNADGQITLVSVVTAGTGYSIGDVIPIVHPNGSGALVEVATVGAGGEVLSTVVRASGSGYEPVEATIEIIHPTGFGFSGLVLTDAGSITGVSILDGGAAYAPLFPTIDIDGPGSGLEFSFDIDPNTGEILSVDILNGGFGYDDGADITVIPALTSGGEGAELELVLAPIEGLCQDMWQSVNVLGYYQAWIGEVDLPAKKKQIEFIKNYFECLGYEFRVEVNPTTGQTLQWRICW